MSKMTELFTNAQLQARQDKREEKAKKKAAKKKELDRIAEEGLRDLEPPSDGETEQHVTDGYDTSDNESVSGLREIIADLNRTNAALVAALEWALIQLEENGFHAVQVKRAIALAKGIEPIRKSKVNELEVYESPGIPLPWSVKTER